MLWQSQYSCIIPRNRIVWIKANPTFNGLLQILYEPEDRVRIQETNPNLDFEKLPFTNINITDKTHVFEDKTDNTFFASQNIPLNSNLISIIGGRGTGKSVLIDYIATAFNKSSNRRYEYISQHYSIKTNISNRWTRFSYSFWSSQCSIHVYFTKSD